MPRSSISRPASHHRSIVTTARSAPITNSVVNVRTIDAVRLGPIDIVNGRSGTRACGNERQESGETVPCRMRFFLRQVLCCEYAFAGSNTQVVAYRHRQAIREEIGCADDQRRSRGESSSGDACDNGEGGDEPVIGAIDEIADIVTDGR